MPNTSTSNLIFAPSYFLSVLLVVLSALAPCAEAIVPTPTQDHEERGPGFVQKTRQAGLVEGFPKLSTPPHSELIRSSVKTMGDLVGMQALYRSALDVPTNVKYFHSRLPKEGWQNLTPPKTHYSPHEEFIEFEKGGKKIGISVEHEDGETEISIEIPVAKSGGK